MGNNFGTNNMNNNMFIDNNIGNNIIGDDRMIRPSSSKNLFCNIGMNNNNNIGMNRINNNLGMNGMSNTMGMNGMNNNIGMNGMNNNMGMNRMNNNMGMNRMNNNIGMNGMNNNMGMNRTNNNIGMNGMNNNIGMNRTNNNIGMNGMNNNIGMNRTNNNIGMNGMNNNIGMNGMNNNIRMNGMNNNIRMNKMNNNMDFTNFMNFDFFLMENLFNECKNIEDPYEIQKKMVMNNNLKKKCPINLNSNAQSLSFFTSSSVENNNKQNVDLINIHFVTMKGNSHVKTYYRFMKISDMLESFITSFGLSKDALKRVHFLFNATNLSKLDKNLKLNEFNIVDHSKINVIDMYDVIGA